MGDFVLFGGLAGVLTALMADDVELFSVCWRLKIRIDGLEVRLRCPRSARRQAFASVTKLTFAQVVWDIYKVQFMRNLGALNEFAKPQTLCLCSGREIEHHGSSSQQESADVRRERVPQSGVAVDECLNVGDLAREKSIEKLVLHKKNSIFSNRQLSCLLRLACCHLPAEENQLR